MKESLEIIRRHIRMAAPPYKTNQVTIFVDNLWVVEKEIEELVEAATDLAELLNDYMTVSSMTANDRYRAALERVNALLGLGADEHDDGRDFTPPYEP